MPTPSLPPEANGGALVPSPAAKPKKNGPPTNPRTIAKNLSVLPVIEPDWSKSPAEIILPCRDQRQGQHLGWHVEDVRAINRGLGLYENLPRICRGEECPYATLCPTRAFGFPFLDLRCPLEILDIYRQFVHHVRELRVNPENTVDLAQIGDLVRIDVTLKRIDQQLQTDGMMTEQIAGIAQKDGTPVLGKGAHQLLTIQRGLRKDRNDLYKQLVASRDIRAKMELARGLKEDDVLDVLKRFKNRIAEQQAAQPGAAPPLKPLKELGDGETIEAEFIAEETGGAADEEEDLEGLGFGDD